MLSVLHTNCCLHDASVRKQIIANKQSMNFQLHLENPRNDVISGSSTQSLTTNSNCMVNTFEW